MLERIEARDARGAQVAMLRLLENARGEIERILDGSRDGPAAQSKAQSKAQPQAQPQTQPQPRRLRQANR